MSCITEILKIKGEEEVYLAKNAVGEVWVAVEGGGTYKDYEWLVVLNTQGHRCGYVAIPPGHKYDSTPLEAYQFMGTTGEVYRYDKLDISCHGGLTFMERDHDLKELLSVPCNDFWVGFDCGHSNDLCDIDALEKYYGKKHGEYIREHLGFMIHGFRSDVFRAKVRTYRYAARQCKQIIEQLIAA